MPSIKVLCDHLHLSVAVAESASVGHLAAMLGSESGASSYFQGGVITYSLQSKVKLLGVDEAHAAACDCVSEQVAQEMAAGVRRLFGTDIGVAITGYAEPNPAHEVDLPFCWVGFAVGERVWAEQVDASEVNILIDENERRVAAQVLFAEMAAEGLLHALQAWSTTPPHSG